MLRVVLYFEVDASEDGIGTQKILWKIVRGLDSWVHQHCSNERFSFSLAEGNALQ